MKRVMATSFVRNSTRTSLVVIFIIHSKTMVLARGQPEAAKLRKFACVRPGPPCLRRCYRPLVIWEGNIAFGLDASAPNLKNCRLCIWAESWGWVWRGSFFPHYRERKLWTVPGSSRIIVWKRQLHAWSTHPPDASPLLASPWKVLFQKKEF